MIQAKRNYYDGFNICIYWIYIFSCFWGMIFLYTPRNLFWILLNQTEIKLYFSFSDWFCKIQKRFLLCTAFLKYEADLFLNLYKFDQTWIVIKLFILIRHQTEFRLQCSTNLVWFSKSRKLNFLGSTDVNGKKNWSIVW